MFGKGKKKKKKADPANRVFNDRPRKIFRHYIGSSEVAFSVFFVLFTAVMGGWFVLQKNNYNPEDRDISMDVLLAQQVEDHLWEPPLLRWTEPGSHVVVGGAAPAPTVGIFPASTVSEGWEESSRMQEFDGTNLADKINGQETQYKAYGFQKLHFIGVANSTENLEMNVYLYDMASFQNSLGIFGARRSAGSKVENRGGSYLYLTEVGAIGIVDKYYFEISGDAPNPKLQEHALRIIGDFAATQAGGSTAPKSFTLLVDGLGVDVGGIEYQPEDVFQYAFCKDFWFGKKTPEGKERYFIHEAASAEEAAKLLGQILEEHQWDYTVVSKEGNRAVLQHNFLKTYFSIEQRDSFVYGIDQAPDTTDAAQSLEALAAKLFSNVA